MIESVPGASNPVHRRIALRLMYDGTDFLGWQRQATGRTVQETLETMLSKLSGDRPVTIVGAGRTDSGVHAHGQVAHADIETRFDDPELLYKLRRMSPPDLVVDALATVPDDFHARYGARRRSYRYRILTRPNPFLARYGWLASAELDRERRAAAAAALLGTRDFTALSKHNPDTPNPICTIYRADWIDGEGVLDFHVTADRFLYGMVRLLVGWQYDVARGAPEVPGLDDLLASRDRNLQSMAVPAWGLSLVAVEYADPVFP